MLNSIDREIERQAKLLNAVWRSTKIRWGCVRHVTSHTPGDEDLLHLTWEEMPEMDRQFDREVMLGFLTANRFDTPWPGIGAWGFCLGMCVGALIVILVQQ